MSKGGRSNEAENQETHDAVSNIDLDYGSAVSAITIETVARVAHTPAGKRRSYLASFQIPVGKGTANQ